MRRRLLEAYPLKTGDYRNAVFTPDMKTGHSRSREWPVERRAERPRTQFSRPPVWFVAG
jgi:hypothetical protein